MSDYPMLISNKLHSFRNFREQIYIFIPGYKGVEDYKCKNDYLLRQSFSSCVFNSQFFRPM